MIETFLRKDLIIAILAIFTNVLFAVVVILVILVKLDTSDHDIEYMLLGQLTSGWFLVNSYYFGGVHKNNNKLELDK